MYLQMYKTSKRYTNSSSNLYFNLQNRQISESVCTSSIEFQFAMYLFLVRIYKPYSSFNRIIKSNWIK